MKFTLNWLKEYLDTDASVADICAKLTALGLEVEGVQDPAKVLDGFVVGHILTAEKHPDADKLRCLVVDTGKEKLNVVCGAPNARAGLKGVFAPVGSYIPGGNITLVKAKIRGVESNGMMCSERELLLSEEHNGIIELPENAIVGSPAAAALGQDDPVIEIKLTPNRGDCAGVYGIARDLASAGLGTLKALPADRIEGAFASPITVSLQADDACPLFIGRYIRGVKNGASPQWLQKRLKAVGLRPISALVDITNYLTVGLNRPLHVFDARKVKGNIHVRFAKKGETLAALNDKAYTLDDGMIAVCDDAGVEGLGGIIGGTATACGEQTTDVFVECAWFDPVRIAKTGRALQVITDARYRFERSVDAAFAEQGMDIATRMILELCGGEASKTVTAGAPPDHTRSISFDFSFTKKLGGVDIPRATQEEILRNLGFILAADGMVKTPSWRPDIEGKADLVEEILRVYGYDNIPAAMLSRPDNAGRDVVPDALRRVLSVRATLAGRGLLETLTWSFMDSRKVDMFGAQQNQNKETLRLVNPISSELDYMRPSILPNLIDAAQRNADRGFADAALFEIGPVFKSTEAAGQIVAAAGIRSGFAVPRHWGAAVRKADVYDAKADALAVIEAAGLNPDSVQITRDAPEWYHPGRSGVLRLGANVIAHFGEMHPDVMDKLRADGPVAGFEVFMAAIPLPKKKTTTAKKALHLSALQPLSRDFAFIVDEKIEAEKIVRAVKSADKALIAAVSVFDVYQGKGVDAGKKSVAIAVTLQPADKTLTDEDIAAISAKIIDAVAAQAGGVLRA